jgi:hypothetical protein
MSSTSITKLLGTTESVECPIVISASEDRIARVPDHSGPLLPAEAKGIVGSEEKVSSSGASKLPGLPKSLLEMKTVPAEHRLMLSTLRSSQRRYFPIRIGYTSFLTPASGIINSSAGVSSFPPLAEFVLLAGLFDEFYCKSFTVHFVPYNQFQLQSTSTFTNPSTGMLLGAPLYHGATTYTSASAMANSGGVKLLSTARPWSMTWHNNEDIKSKVTVNSSTTSPIPSQGWCLTSASSAVLYQGQLQFRNQGVIAAAASATVGELLITGDFVFRVRG